MVIYLIIVIGAVVALVIVLSMKQQSAIRRAPLDTERSRKFSKKFFQKYQPFVPPVYLGLREEIPLQSVVSRLDNIMTGSFMEQVKARILASRTKMTENEYEWKLLELKRYFIINTIVQQASMFS